MGTERDGSKKESSDRRKSFVNEKKSSFPSNYQFGIIVNSMSDGSPNPVTGSVNSSPVPKPREDDEEVKVRRLSKFFAKKPIDLSIENVDSSQKLKSSKGSSSGG